MNKRILIIDRNNEFRIKNAEALRRYGFDVTETNNGKLGLNYVSRDKPDLILCDIAASELNGYGVYNSLTKDKETAVIPFIFSTDNGNIRHCRKNMEMGADDCLVKPITTKELINAIESRLNKIGVLKGYFDRANHTSPDIPEGKDALNDLISSRKMRIIKKRNFLYYEGDEPSGIYMIFDGNVKTIKLSKDGKEFMTGIYKANDYLGVNAVILGETFNESAIAITDTTVCLLPKDAILTLLNRYPNVNKQFLKILSNDLHQKEEQMLELAYNSVRKRLAQMLLRLSRQSQNSSTIKIFREELAAMTGMAVETVCRTLSDFKAEGLIDKTNGQVTLIDIERLVKLKN